jgi:hypothetical protein
MKILTTNHPIIVNGVRESKASDYMSADGDLMTDVVSSKNPIIVNGKDISNPTWYLAEGSRVSQKRASNISQRIAKNERIKANAQARIDAINNRVTASGKPMGRVDSNIVRGLQKEVARTQAMIDKLNAMTSSSANGDDYYSANGDDFYNIDQKNTVDVKAFQTFANSQGAKLVVDGIWGDKTQAEWNKYGAQWEATKNPVTQSQAPTMVANAPVVPQGGTPTANQVADAKKKGLFWDKVKGAWVYAKEGGILDWVGNLLGIKPPPAFQPTPPTATTTTTTTTNDDNNKGMSKTTKTLLIVGGVLVLGFVIFEIAKKKK